MSVILKKKHSGLILPFSCQCLDHYGRGDVWYFWCWLFNLFCTTDKLFIKWDNFYLIFLEPTFAADMQCWKHRSSVPGSYSDSLLWCQCNYQVWIPQDPLQSSEFFSMSELWTNYLSFTMHKVTLNLESFLRLWIVNLQLSNAAAAFLQYQQHQVEQSVSF